MFSFFRRRKYRADVNEHINELFAAMPKEYLSTAKQLVNLEAAINRSFQAGTSTKQCAIYCAAFLMAAPIQRMDQATRNDLLRQYENSDPGAFNVGLNVLLSTAMKYTDNLATNDCVEKVNPLVCSRSNDTGEFHLLSEDLVAFLSMLLR
jgi:hypothetical protein